MKFNKEQFEGAKGGGGFEKIEDGDYDASITKIELRKKSDTLTEQVSVTWKISPNSDDFPNRTIFWTQTVVNKNGEDNDIGLDAISTFIKRVSEDSFDFEEFRFDDEGKVTNFEEVMKQFVGTEARIKVIGKESGQYINYQVYVNEIYQMTYKPDERNKTIAEEYVEDIMDTQGNTSVTEVEVEIGMRILFQDAKLGAEQQYGEIILFEETTNQIMVKHYKSGKTFMVSPDDLICPTDEQKTRLDNQHSEFINPVVEEAEEELEEETTLERGMQVNASVNGSNYSGTVNKINEDEGTVQIAFTNKDGKRVGKTVPISAVVPF